MREVMTMRALWILACAALAICLAGCAKPEGPDKTTTPQDASAAPKKTPEQPGSKPPSPSHEKAPEPSAAKSKGPADELNGADLALAGKSMYDTFPCKNCHELGGQGGHVGPKLDHVGDHDAAWQLAHLKDPKSKSPRSRMPSFANQPKEKLELLAKWLASLK
jgi:cytochrome c553